MSAGSLTTEQLDELEARAKELIGRMHVETDPLLGVSTCDLLHLVAVYRAALAVDSACDPHCSGWGHTDRCDTRRGDAVEALRASLRGAP